MEDSYILKNTSTNVKVTAFVWINLKQREVLFDVLQKLQNNIYLESFFDECSFILSYRYVQRKTLPHFQHHLHYVRKRKLFAETLLALLKIVKACLADSVVALMKMASV